MSEPDVAEILEEARTIAVVGASTSPRKAAHRVPAYLQEQGYRIIPVNPSADEVFGEPAVERLADITENVDIVDVFRPADEAPGIAEETVAIGASVLWLQSGISSDEARDIAGSAGLDVVMDRCIGATHQRVTRS